MRPASLLLALALCAGDGYRARLAGAGPADELDDEEGDSAPFMVVVRHAEGRACGAALVSLRTALSSAACARGHGDMWAVAPGRAGGVRRVVRVAVAAGDPAGARPVAGDPWAGADGDLALLELAAPLPAARAILMATDPADCEPPQGCHLVRFLRMLPGNTPTSLRGGDSSTEGGAARLRIVDAQLEAGHTCAARGPRWPALRARTLCLSGPELCEGDRGTGVVCAGKLCGVVSRSAGGARLCGDAHAAASVPRYRRFLHCAHTRGACGRDGECARLCSEQWLVDAPTRPTETRPHTSPAPWPRPPVRVRPDSAAQPATLSPFQGAPPADALQLGARTHTAPLLHEATASPPPRAPPEPAPARTDAPPALHPAPPRGALEYEPNRADFKMSAASTSVSLKAGEYGDNAAEYAAPEDTAAAPPVATALPAHDPDPETAPAPMPASATSPAPPSRTAPPAAGPAPAPALTSASGPRPAPAPTPAGRPQGARSQRVQHERLAAAARGARLLPTHVVTLVLIVMYILYQE